MSLFFFSLCVNVLVARTTQDPVTIWSSNVQNNKSFAEIEGTVVFFNSSYCRFRCAAIGATYDSSYLVTEAINTTGYNDIYLTFSFALADGWNKDNYFKVAYFEGNDWFNVLTISDYETSGYNLNQKYSDQNVYLEHCGDTSTVYIRFSAWIQGNSGGTVYVDDISLTGDLFNNTNDTTKYDRIPSCVFSD